MLRPVYPGETNRISTVLHLDDRSQREFVINLFVWVGGRGGRAPGLPVPCLLLLRSKEAGLFLGDAVLPLSQGQLGAVPPAGGGTKRPLTFCPSAGERPPPPAVFTGSIYTHTQGERFPLYTGAYWGWRSRLYRCATGDSPLLFDVFLGFLFVNRTCSDAGVRFFVHFFYLEF